MIETEAERIEALEIRLLAGPPEGFKTADPWSEAILAALVAGWELNPNASAFGEPTWRFALRDPQGKIVGWRWCDSAIGVCKDLRIGPFAPSAQAVLPLRPNVE